MQVVGILLENTKKKLEYYNFSSDSIQPQYIGKLLLVLFGSKILNLYSMIRYDIVRLTNLYQHTILCCCIPVQHSYMECPCNYNIFSNQHHMQVQQEIRSPYYCYSLDRISILCGYGLWPFPSIDRHTFNAPSTTSTDFVSVLQAVAIMMTIKTFSLANITIW